MHASARSEIGRYFSFFGGGGGNGDGGGVCDVEHFAL